MNRPFPAVIPLLLAVVAARAQEVPGAVEAAFAKAVPPPAESRWTQIPWRRSLTQALAEARQAGKPVYLFVNDGNVDCGRC